MLWECRDEEGGEAGSERSVDLLEARTLGMQLVTTSPCRCCPSAGFQLDPTALRAFQVRQIN